MPSNPLTSRVGQVFIPQVPLEEEAPSRPQPGAPGSTEPKDAGPIVDLLPALVRPDSEGYVSLKPGLYLIDTTLSEWHRAWPILIETFGKDAMRELNVVPSRDMAMATFYLEQPAKVVLPVPVYAVEPNNAMLLGIARRVGYDGIMQPVGILEWASTNFPEAFEASIKAAEKVRDAAKVIGFGLGGIVAMGLGLLFATRLLKGGR